MAFRPNPLGRETDIAVTFRTLIPNATILAAAENLGRKRRDLDQDATDVIKLNLPILSLNYMSHAN